MNGLNIKNKSLSVGRHLAALGLEKSKQFSLYLKTMKPSPADEMFSEGVGTYAEDDMMSMGGNIVMDSVRDGIHKDFNNSFGDLFDEDDLA